MFEEQKEVRERVQQELTEIYAEETAKSCKEKTCLNQFKIIEFLLDYYFEKVLLQDEETTIEGIFESYNRDKELLENYIPARQVLKLFGKLYQDAEHLQEINDVKMYKKYLLNQFQQVALQEKELSEKF